VDYGLFVGRKLCGVIEAKPEGTTLSGYSEQAARYIADVPKHLVREEGQVRFEYVASGTETLFRPPGTGAMASQKLTRAQRHDRDRARVLARHHRRPLQFRSMNVGLLCLPQKFSAGPLSTSSQQSSFIA